MKIDGLLKNKFSRPFFSVFLLGFLILIFYKALIISPPNLGLPNDGQYTILAWVNILRTSVIENHQLPQWIESFAAGTPYQSTFLSQTFFPPVFLIHLLVPSDVVALRLTVLLLLIMAGAAMFYLMRVIGANQAGAFLAGLSYALSGPFISRLQSGHTNFLTGLSLAPAILLTLFLALARPKQRLKWASLGAIFLGLMILGGGIPTIIYLLIFVILIVLARLIGLILKKNRRESVVILGLATLLIGLGMALSAVKLLPVYLYFTNESARGNAGQNTTISSSDNFHSFREVVLSLTQADPEKIRVSGQRPGLPWESASFVGWTILVLGLLGMIKGRMVFWQKLALLTILVLSLWLSFGARAPFDLYEALLNLKIPFLQTLRIPTRLNFGFVLPLIVFAGLGISWLISYTAKKSYSVAGIIFLVAIFFVLWESWGYYKNNFALTAIRWAPGATSDKPDSLALFLNQEPSVRDLPQQSKSVEINVPVINLGNTKLLDSEEETHGSVKTTLSIGDKKDSQILEEDLSQYETYNFTFEFIKDELPPDSQALLEAEIVGIKPFSQIEGVVNLGKFDKKNEQIIDFQPQLIANDSVSFLLAKKLEGEKFRAAAYPWFYFDNHTSTILGLQNTHTYDNNMLDGYYQAMAYRPVQTLIPIASDFREYPNELLVPLSLLNTRYILLDKIVEPLPDAVEEIAKIGDTIVFRNKNTLGEAWTTNKLVVVVGEDPRSTVATSAEILHTIKFSPRQWSIIPLGIAQLNQNESLIKTASGIIVSEPLVQRVTEILPEKNIISISDTEGINQFFSSSEDYKNNSDISVEILEPKPGQFRINYKTPGEEPLFINISDSFARGWLAREGGGQLPVYPGYGFIKTIVLFQPSPQGEIELNFRTPGLTVGAIISLVSLFLLSFLSLRRSGLKKQE